VAAGEGVGTRQHQSCQFDPQFGPAPQVSATTPQFSPATPQVSSPVAADIEEGEVLPQGASMSRETLLEWLKSSIDWLTLGDRTPARETALAAANRLHELAVWPDADVAGIEKMARKYNLIDDALGGPPPPPPFLTVPSMSATPTSFGRLGFLFDSILRITSIISKFLF
jgi:hypothetical protein